MSTRPNSNNVRHVAQGVIAGIVVVVILLALSQIDFDRGGSPTAPPSYGPAAQPATQVPVRNPIEQLLDVPQGIQGHPGVAVAVLVDVSGSMGEAVPDSRGGKQPKIEIARRRLLDLVGQADRFTREHPDRDLLLGVYEFSSLERRDSCRQVIPLGKPDPAAAASAVARMKPNGSTPIGDALIRAKRDLDATGRSRLHILVITDGENNRGYNPDDVVGVLARQEPEHRASVYFIAFDVAAAKFNRVREAGGLVLAAANENELQQTLDYVLTGKILAEQPAAPGKP